MQPMLARCAASRAWIGEYSNKSGYACDVPLLANRARHYPKHTGGQAVSGSGTLLGQGATTLHHAIRQPADARNRDLDPITRAKREVVSGHDAGAG